MPTKKRDEPFLRKLSLDLAHGVFDVGCLLSSKEECWAISNPELYYDYFNTWVR